MSVSYPINPEVLVRNWLFNPPPPVPTDNKFHQITQIEIPEGYHHLELGLQFKVRKSLPAPFVFQLLLVREDRWVPAVFFKDYKSDDFVPHSTDWQYQPGFSEPIESDKPYNYFLMAKLESPIHLEATVEVTHKEIVRM
jgi:hypothetical protein